MRMLTKKKISLSMRMQKAKSSSQRNWLEKDRNMRGGIPPEKVRYPLFTPRKGTKQRAGGNRAPNGKEQRVRDNGAPNGKNSDGSTACRLEAVERKTRQTKGFMYEKGTDNRSSN